MTDSQKERSSTQRKSVRESDESQARALRAVRNYFLKKYESVVIVSCAPYMRSCLHHNKHRKKGASVTRRGAERQDEIKQAETGEGFKASAESGSIFGCGG